MTTFDTRELAGWRGRELVGADGERIGKVHDVYLDDETGQPEWLSVSTGMFGSHVSFVPLTGTETSGGGELVSQWTKDQVKDAPRADADGGSLSAQDEEQLYAHYGLGRTEAPSGSGLPAGGAPTGTTTGALGTDTGADTSGPSTDTAMTRSEEELRVGTQTREAGRARLRKWVETEHVSQTVPVSHEEVRVEREPITDGNVDQAMDGPEISSEEHEMPLLEQQAVANTEVVPKERVRLDKQVVQEQQQVDAELRKEQVEVDTDATTR